MSRLDLFALGFGAMIGWGWVVLAGDWLRIGGTLGVVVAFLIGATMCVFVGLVYAELTAAIPVAGGPVAFAERTLNGPWTWGTGWILCLAYMSVVAWESVAITRAVNFLLPLPKVGYLWTLAGQPVYISWCVPSMMVSLALCRLNLRGMRATAMIQTVATIVLIVVGFAFISCALGFGSLENTEPLWTSLPGVASVLMMVPFMLVGFDAIPQAVEECHVPRSVVGRTLVLSVIAAAAWYILVSLSLAYSVPAAVRNLPGISVGNAMETMSGSTLWAKILVVGGICGILTSWNAFLVSVSRLLFALGKRRFLPQGFAHIDPDTGAPALSICAATALSIMAPFLGSGALTWLANVGGFCTCVTYLIVVVCFLILRRSHPELARPFRAARGVGFSALLVTGVFVALYLPLGPSSLSWPYEWAIVLGWVALGLVLTAAQKTMRQGVENPMLPATNGGPPGDTTDVEG